MEIDGPRPVKREEFPALRRLLNNVFLPGGEADMFELFPYLLNESNAERLMVMAEGGELVSHAGMLVREWTCEGVPLTLGLVGSVATAQRCEGKGYATRCLGALFADAADNGVDAAWISGHLRLYLSRGAARVGKLRRFDIPASAPEADIELHELTKEDIPQARALYSRQPARFLQTREDWEQAFRTRYILNSPNRLWGVRRGGRLSAYLFMCEEGPPNRWPLLSDFAGDRRDVAAALPEILARMKLAGAEVYADANDANAQEIFGPIAKTTHVEPIYGSILMLRMAACMERLRPRIAKFCGRRLAEGLRFSESGVGPGTRAGKDDRLRIELDGATVELAGRAEVSKLLFGPPEGDGPPVVAGDATVLERLMSAFPLPPPWFGINYV